MFLRQNPQWGRSLSHRPLQMRKSEAGVQSQSFPRWSTTGLCHSPSSSWFCLCFFLQIWGHCSFTNNKCFCQLIRGRWRRSDGLSVCVCVCVMTSSHHRPRQYLSRPDFTALLCHRWEVFTSTDLWPVSSWTNPRRRESDGRLMKSRISWKTLHVDNDKVSRQVSAAGSLVTIIWFLFLMRTLS